METNTTGSERHDIQIIQRQMTEKAVKNKRKYTRKRKHKKKDIENQ